MCIQTLRTIIIIFIVGRFLPGYLLFVFGFVELCQSVFAIHCYPFVFKGLDEGFLRKAKSATLM